MYPGMADVLYHAASPQGCLSGNLYSKGILLLVLSHISVFIKDSLSPLFCHNDQ